MSRKRKQYEDDDGRVIHRMNVEGMPWYDKSAKLDNAPASNNTLAGQMTRSETRTYTWYSLGVAGLIGLVFSATWVLLVLFCTEIWFK